MEEYKGNQYVIPLLISKLAEIDNARYSMYDKENIYYQVPKFLFKYKVYSDDTIYEEIKTCVEKFKGKLEWTLVIDDNPRRYRTLIPKLYAKSFLLNEKNEKDVFDTKTYNLTCEQAIEDIPQLAKHISDYFNII